MTSYQKSLKAGQYSTCLIGQSTSEGISSNTFTWDLLQGKVTPSFLALADVTIVQNKNN